MRLDPLCALFLTTLTMHVLFIYVEAFVDAEKMLLSNIV